MLLQNLVQYNEELIVPMNEFTRIIGVGFGLRFRVEIYGLGLRFRVRIRVRVG